MKYLLKFILFMTPVLLSAQDRQFSQYYSSPLLLNPAFTGVHEDFRGGLNGRVQWTGLKKTYNSASAFADFYSTTLKSGFGLLFNHESFGGTGLESNEIYGTFSYKISVSPLFNIKAGLMAGYASRNINLQNLLFEDQYTGNRPDGSQTIDPVVKYEKSQYLDLSSGILIYGANKYWLSVGVFHLNKPKTGDATNNKYLPVKTLISGGLNLDVNTMDSAKAFRLTPAFVYKSQNSFDQIDLGLFASKKDFVVGLFYKRVLFSYLKEKPTTGLLSFQGGLQLKNITFVYSYDHPVSGTPNLGNSHEISLIVIRNRSRKASNSPLPY